MLPRLLLALISTLLACSVFYIAFLGIRSHELYFWVKEVNERRPQAIYVADDQLGYTTVAGAESIQRIGGNPVLVKFDDRGFRIPESQPTQIGSEPGPRVLFLGGSWTHGEACTAEDSFPDVAGRALEGTSWNAGMSAFGLAQMVVHARQLIPELEPDYVVAQYSSWLVKRAQSFYAPSAFGTVPAPYFTEDDGRLAVHPPVFVTNNYDVPIWDYRGPAGVAEFLGFSFRVSRRIFGYADSQRALLLVRRGLGLVPRPARNRKRVVTEAYSEISRIARDHGAATLVVTMELGCERVDDLSGIRGVRIVDANSEMCRFMPAIAKSSPRKNAKGLKWDQAYSHWGGDPLRVVNRHPNPAGHRIIGRAVAREIRRLMGQNETSAPPTGSIEDAQIGGDAK